MILVTRPRHLAVVTAHVLKALGYKTLILPMLHLSYMYKEISDDDYSFIIITSQNAIHAIKNLEWIKTKKVYVVGSKMASLLNKIGYRNILVCEESKQSSEGILDLIESNESITEKCLYISGADVAGNLEVQLRGLGYNINREIVYKSISTEYLSGSAIDSINSLVKVVLFYSPRTAIAFSRLAKKYQMDLVNKTAVCISKKTADNLEHRAWDNILVAKNSNESSLIMIVKNEISK